MKLPNVLFVLHLPPPVHGSAIVGEQIYKSELINNSFNCDYINLSTSKKLSEVGKKEIIKYVRSVSIYIKLISKLISKKYDLCYLAITVGGLGLLKDFPLVIISKLFNKKIVIHQHNKGVCKYQHNKIYDLIYRFIYKETSVILLSFNLYDDISKYVPLSNILICPNGIKVLNNEELIQRSRNDMFTFLFLSNLIESKGCLVLLEACKILKDNGYKFKCDFVGNESKLISSDRFCNMINNLGLNDFVSYHGPKYNNEKNIFFSNSHCFVFPTFYENETFGLVLLEAMQNNLPVITTDEGGITDIVIDGYNGFIIEKNNILALVDKMEFFLNNFDIGVNMGIRGKELFLKQYTESIFEQKMMNTLKIILNK